MCICTPRRTAPACRFSCNYFPSADTAVSRSVRMADQRCSPSVLIAALWAARQAGMPVSICRRPLVVIASSTRPPRPPPSVVTKPSRCNGRRFRTSVVRSTPSVSLNSAMLQLSLALSASSMVDCVVRIPCRRSSASKNLVITRDAQRKLKHTQFSVTEKSNSFGMRCAYAHQVSVCQTSDSISPLTRAEKRGRSREESHPQTGGARGESAVKLS